jgi:hypothetical protein
LMCLEVGIRVPESASRKNLDTFLMEHRATLEALLT